MDLKVSPVYLANHKSNKFITINRGGMRSGKTYSILQVLIIKYGLMRKGLIIDIVRKTKAELHDTVYKDFIEILTNMGIYNERNHHKTRQEYYMNGNTFRFIGIDKAQKKRGAKRNILYINEANGLTLDDWVQLSGRTGEKIYIDYNPSEYFWVNSHIMETEDPSRWEEIHSSYLDNYDFLPESQIKTIENLINVDQWYYDVYVLGKPAMIKGKIYTNYKLITGEEYDAIQADDTFYGIDWGYEHYTCIVEIKWAAEQCYEKCLYMETHKLDIDVVSVLEKNNVSYTDDIFPDPAYPGSVAKIRDAGYSVTNANKNVKDGLQFCRGLKRNICNDGSPASLEFIRQMGRYKLKTLADGTIVDGEPIKKDDDGPDAQRYGEYTKLRHIYNPMGI